MNKNLSPVSSRPTVEAFQPALWDRLTDDLPGTEAEILVLEQALAQSLGVEKFADLRHKRDLDWVNAGVSEDDRRTMRKLAVLIRKREQLAERGIIVSSDVLREAVRSDLESLFNTVCYDSSLELTELERATVADEMTSLENFPEVRKSVLNFGVPAFAGHAGHDFDQEQLRRKLRDIIIAFEPRLEPKSIKVNVSFGERPGGLNILIEGVLIMVPVPERLRFRTRIDLDTGDAKTSVDEF